MSRPVSGRVVLIGLDGANYKAIKPLISKGQLPNLARLIKEGTLCINALAPYPTLTASNWATIATGAWPGTHGVTDMSYHVTGEPLNSWHSGFTSDAIEAETLWESIARAGKKAAVLKYPGSWPPRHPGVVMIDGGGGRPFWGGSYLEISHSQIFSTTELPNGHLIKLSRATGWHNIPESNLPPLETCIEFSPQSGNIPESLRFKTRDLRQGKTRRFFCLIIASRYSGYDTSFLCSTRDVKSSLATVKAGKWSPSFECEFEIKDKTVTGGMRFKVIELSAKGDKLTIYFSQIYPSKSLSQPPEIGSELVKRFGSYINHPGYSEEAMGWFDTIPETYLELMEYQNNWLGKAGRYLLESTECDLLAMQSHCIDFANHAFTPRHNWDEKTCATKLALLARCYRSVDDMVGQLVAGAGPHALVIMVSDHGATESPCKEVFVNPILEKAGFLVYEEDDTRKDSFGKPSYPRSMAISERVCHIYINLKDRDPGGIVSPEEYETIREKVIHTLLKWRHPETGYNPFSMVIPKEDARIFGIFDSLGRDIGDIIYALKPEYDHEHGRQLPTATSVSQSMSPLLIFRGPGIKKGFLLARNVWLVDIVPTIAQIMHWPPPTETEGSILYQLFSSHSSVFPRRDFLEQQTRRKKTIRTVSKYDRRKKTSESIRQTAAPAQSKIEQKEELLPQTFKEMQMALIKARSEACKWRDAYESYYRITHGN